MPNEIQKDMDVIATTVQTLADFVAKYGEKIPDGLGWISATSSKAHFRIDLDYQNAENTQRALATVADIFGPNGWVSKHQSESLRKWVRIINEVEIQIDGAEKLPKADDRKVAPIEFPTLLQNAND